MQEQGVLTPRKSQVAIQVCFLIKSGTDPPQEAIGPLGWSNCFLMEVCMAICEIVDGFKGIDYCPIEVIKGLTDKGQFQYLTKSKGPQVGNYLYTAQFLSLR